MNIMNRKLNKWITLIYFVLITLLSIGVMQTAAAQQSAPEQKTDETVKSEDRQGTKYKSGYERVPVFGGPTTVGSQLRKDNEIKEPLFRFPKIDKGLKPWFDWKKSLQKEQGLSLGVHYTTLFQWASDSLGEDNAASSRLGFLAAWNLVGRDTDHPGSLVFKLEHRRRLGSDVPPQTLGIHAGSILPTGLTYNDYGWAVTHLYWQQKFFDGRVDIVAGRLFPPDYIDVYALTNPLDAFMNSAFSTNPSSAIPLNGLGAAAAVLPTENFYILAGLYDANGVPTREGFDTFFEDNEYYKQIEFGFISSLKRAYLDNIHITLWHQDEREDAGKEKSKGVTFSMTKFIGDKWMPFLRAGFSDGDASLLNSMVSAGFAVYFAEHRDQLGFGINWGEPSNNALDDQYSAELFYRFQLAQNLAITPDVQLIIDPALNPDEDHIWMYGLRCRLAL